MPRPRFVDALLFDPEFNYVALIRKIKPAWQAGKLNCVGGKIEPGETPEDAVRREFREETGVDVPEWKRFLDLDLDRDNGELICFYSANKDLFKVSSTTEEQVVIFSVDAVMNYKDTIPNLKWLIQMARSFGLYGESIKKFAAKEIPMTWEEVSA